MFDVGCSSFKTTPHGINATCECLQNTLTLLRKDTHVPGFGNRLLAGVDVDLTVDVDCVSFDGLGGNEKLFGNLLVAQPLCQEVQDLNLTVRQGLIQGLGADR